MNLHAHSRDIATHKVSQWSTVHRSSDITCTTTAIVWTTCIVSFVSIYSDRRTIRDATVKSRHPTLSWFFDRHVAITWCSIYVKATYVTPLKQQKSLFYPVMCKSPYAPLQDELLCWRCVVGLYGDNWREQQTRPKLTHAAVVRSTAKLCVSSVLVINSPWLFS